MSVELLKSMTYRDGKVFTRQSSNNVTPKDYTSCEHTGMTKRYQELGRQGFEKAFLNDSLIDGNYRILDDCNDVLKKLKKIADHLYLEDTTFKDISNDVDIAERKLFDIRYNKEPGNEEAALQEYKDVKAELREYVNQTYDRFSQKYKEQER